MQKTEAKKTIKLIHYLKSAECPIGTCAIEVKVMKGNRFYLAAIKEHQLNALKNTKRFKIVFKIPDFGAQNPFDVFCLEEEPAFVVVIKDNIAYFIGIEIILDYSKKSMDIEMIKKVASLEIILK